MKLLLTVRMQQVCVFHLPFVETIAQVVAGPFVNHGRLGKKEEPSLIPTLKTVF